MMSMNYISRSLQQLQHDMKTLLCLLMLFVMNKNTKFRLDVSEQKYAIFPIQVHDLFGFLSQAPGGP